MADNYTQFSFAVALESDDEREWAKRACAFLVNIEELLTTEGEDGVILDTHEFYSILPGDEYEYGISTSFDVDEDGLWIHSDGEGNPNDAVPLVMTFLRKFHPDRVIFFTWADTCSKPRLHQFGGGAVCISAFDEEWQPTFEWITSTSQRMLRDAEALVQGNVDVVYKDNGES